MADLPTVDELDELVDVDPIRLRDKALAMRAEAEHLRATLARVRSAMANTLLQGPNAILVVRLADLRAALDGPDASEQTGGGNG